MKVRKFSIISKLLFFIVILLLLSDVVLTLMAYRSCNDILNKQIRMNNESIASAVAVEINPQTVAAVQPGEEKTEAYLKESYLLTDFLYSTGVEYIYTIRYRADGSMEYSVDSQFEPAMIGDDFTDDEAEPALSGTVVSNSEPYTDEWGTHLSSYVPIYDGDTVVGAVGVDSDYSWILEQQESLVRTVMIAGACVFVLGILVLIILFRSLRHKFVMLNDKISDLSQGDGDLTKKIELTSGDEFEVIGENINQLIEFIRGLLLSINSESDRLHQSSANIADSVRSARSNADIISNTMTDMSATMEESAAAINEINSLITDINESFSGIAGEVNECWQYSNEVRESAVSIGENAAKGRETTETKVAAMAQAVSDKIERSKAVSRIEDLTGNIISISSQTNLLALNASIEAARAGDAGRGFAVVAEEIGALANNSQETASEIKQVSGEVIAAVNELAHESEKLIQFTNDTTMEGFTDLVETSEKYLETAERTADMMTRLNEVVAEIQTKVERISESANMVNDAVGSAAEDVVQTAEKSVDMSGEMSRIDGEATASNSISGELRDEVGKFKL